MPHIQDLILSFAGSQFNEVGEKCFQCTRRRQLRSKCLFVLLSFKINALAALKQLEQEMLSLHWIDSAAHEHVAVPFYVTPYLPSPVFLRPRFLAGLIKVDKYHHHRTLNMPSPPFINLW
eukprot:scaffold7512_cov133-Skeletonema_marinoi.AAC.3